MNRFLATTFFLFCLCLVSRAGEIVTLKFQCSPADALVEIKNERLEWEVLGKASETLQFEAEKFSLYRFSAPGYKSREESIAVPALRSADKEVAIWPSNGTLDLEPEPLTRLKALVLPVSGLAILGILAIGFVRRKRAEAIEQAERIEYLETIQSEAKATKDSVLGQRLGKYLLTAFLGKGGMAVVYRAVSGKDLKTGEHVAVKVLSAVEDEQTIQRFHREVKICQKLIHPNIVSLYDWGKDEDLIYLAMELIEGGSLEDRLKEGNLSYGEALRIFNEILAGMEFAHAQGVTHRDLKPDNIMLTANNRVKVTDFGLAKLQTIRTVTVSGAVMGTPAYMAPEQIQGQDPDPSMDQYALGVLAYEIFSGQLPFETTDMMAVITKHLIEKPPHPHTVKEDLPDNLCDIIMKMLEKEPSDRFADLGEVRSALRRVSA